MPEKYALIMPKSATYKNGTNIFLLDQKKVISAFLRMDLKICFKRVTCQETNEKID